MTRFRAAAVLLSLLSTSALAGHNEPVGCPQLPALTGAVTSTIGNCATADAAGSSQSQPATPTKPASTTTFKMQGLAGSITPVRSGRVLLIISGEFISTSTTVGVGAQVQLSFGTGSAPANAATLQGTQVGVVREYLNPTTVTAADVFMPFTVNAVVTGLALNTVIWIDLAAKSVSSASAVGVTDISISAIEF